MNKVQSCDKDFT